MKKLHKTVALGLLLLSPTLFFGQSNMDKAIKKFELNEYFNAISLFEKILTKEPNNALALEKLAEASRRVNDTKESEKYFFRRVNLPNFEPVLLPNYGKVLMSNQKYDLAKKIFENYAAKFPTEGKKWLEYIQQSEVVQKKVSKYEISPLNILNTSLPDFGVSFLNNQKIVFASARKDLKNDYLKFNTDWNGKSENQLFAADLSATGSPNKPILLKTELQNSFNDAPVSYSADGKWVAITKNNFSVGTRQTISNGLELSIYIAESTNKGVWSKPKPFEFNTEGYSTGYAFLNADGTEIYYSSNRPGGQGGFDLYFSEKTNNIWSSPVNLGTEINTKGDEITPFVEGNILYFASDFHAGLGGHDIFAAHKKDKMWQNIENLGAPVNSSKDDFGYAVFSKINTGFLVSNREGGAGLEDIYLVRKKPAAVTVNILVQEEKTKKNIEKVNIFFEKNKYLDWKKIISERNGNYKFTLKENEIYQVNIQKEGYENYALAIPTFDEDQNGVVNFQVSLKKSLPLLSGKIIDAEDKNSLALVNITATNPKNTEQITCVSDSNGLYQMKLKTNETYLFSFQAANYVSLNRTVKTPEFLSATTYLGTTEMTSQKSNKKNKVVTGAPLPSKKTEDGNIFYAIQLASFDQAEPAEKTDFPDLKDLGDIYVVEKESKFRVRLGDFGTKKEASDVLKIINSRDVKSGFVVEVGLAPAPSSENNNTSSKLNPKKEGNFRIRLGAFKTWTFDERKFVDLGVLSKEKTAAGLTVVHLGLFSTLTECRSSQLSVEKLGFKNTLIEQKKDNIWAKN